MHTLRREDLFAASLIAAHLFDYQHELVASPSYLANHGAINCIEDLDPNTCLSSFAQPVWPLKNGEVQTTSWLRSNQHQQLKNAALNHLGIIRIADYFVKEEIERGELVPILTHERLPASGSMYLLYPQVLFPSVKAQAFVDFVKNYPYGV